jgi:chromosome segregation ATPase
MMFDQSLHASLREEVAALRKKVVALETAEADNEKLRKDLIKLRVTSLEQKSQLELDFMNQLTGVARENALKLEELEGRLAESTNVNRAMGDRLKSSPSREMVEKEMQALEAQHRKDLATTIDANKLEIERTRQQLAKLMESRDQLVEEFDEAKETLAAKEKEIESLKQFKQTTEGGASSKVELQKIRRELEDLQSSRDRLAMDLQQAQTSLTSKDVEINSIKMQLASKELKLEETSRELQRLRASHEKVVAELVDSKTSLRMKQAEIDSFKSSQNNTDSANKAELEKALRQLSLLETSRAEQSQQLAGAKSDLNSKQQEIDAIKTTKLSSEAFMQKRLDEANRETSQWKSRLQSLEVEQRDQQSTSSDGGATRILEEKLRSRDKELSTKSSIIDRLEAQIEYSTETSSVGMERAKVLEEEKSRLKAATQKLETEKMQQGLTSMRLERSNQELTKKHEIETRILKERLNRRDEELTEKTSEMQLLELQVSESFGKIAASEEKLKFLQEENRELTKKYNRADEENKVQPTKLFERESSDRDIDEIANNRKSVGGFSPQFNAHEKKTTQIIRRLEQNLKKEGETKKAMAAGMKNKSSTEADQKRMDAMRYEIDSLTNKLDNERDQTNTLRREISELKAYHAAPSIPSITERKTSLLTSSPKTPTTAKAKYSQNELSRTPVRGLVQTFENQAVNRVKALEDFSSFNTSNVEELKDALHLERQQVFELEDELTRQCEINCSLLKEIASLTQETESSRSQHVNAFHVGNGSERKKVEKLSGEVAHLKRLVKAADDEKSSLSSRFENLATSDRKEIDRLTAEISSIRNKLSEAEKKHSSVARFELSSTTDRKEADRLKLQIRQLEDRMSESQRELQQVRGDNVGGKAEIERLQQKISSLGEERQSKRKQSEDQEMRVSQLEMEVERLQGEASLAMKLEIELAQLNAMKSDYSSRGDEIDGLRSLVEGLEASLVNANLTKAALQTEKETAARLDLLVQKLEGDLKVAEDKVEKVSSDIATLNESGQENSSRVESLTRELKQSNERRDEMEKNCRVNHTGQISTLTMQVDSLQHELEHVKELHLLQSAEEITNLTSQIDSLSEQLKQAVEERDEAQEQNRVHFSKFDSLRAEIDGKVNEFERIHVGDKKEISQLQMQIKSMEKELSASLATVENMRVNLREKEEVEETVENLQRENQHSLDSQINKLQKELTQTRVTEADTEKKLRSLENTIITIQEDSKKALASKEETLVEMRKALGEKEGNLERLSKEKEQLILSMKDMTSSRRDEIDELQSELMEMSTRTANQAREVQTLKIELEDGNYRKEEMDRLRRRVRELSQELANQDPDMAHEEKSSELQLENGELRQRLRDANLALKGAEEKIRDVVADKGNSKSMQVLRDRNASLKFEVEKLTKKLRKLSERKHMHEQHRSNSAGQERTSDRRSYTGSEHSRAEESVEATRFMI